MIDQYHWVYFDYKRGWVGVRIEPEDRDRSDAIKRTIPEEDRMYLRDRRTWIFRPKYAPQIIEIIRNHCAGFQVILQTENFDLLRLVLLGSAVLTETNPISRTEYAETAPIGKSFGTPERLGEQ